MSATNKILIAGFTALVLTVSVSTYVLNGAIKRSGFNDRYVIMAIEEQGKSIKDAVRGKPEY